MPKILHIARPIAGVGVYIALICKYINEDFDNFIICNENENNIKLENSKGDEIKSFHVPIIRKINLIQDLKCLIQVIRVIRYLNPDIIHCHSAKAGLIGRLASIFFFKKKIFYTPHAYSFLSAESDNKKFFFTYLEKIFSFTKTKTIACSESEYNRSVNDLNISPKKVCVWNNSIEFNFNLKKSKILESLPEKFICSIGRPSFQKNTDLLIDTMFMVKKKIFDIHLVILGAGLDNLYLEKIIEKIDKLKLQDNITIIKWLDRSESLAILEKSQFCVSTSLYEGLPYSLIEALALSKPCIVTNVDGNKDLVKNEYNGYKVSLDKKEIAEKICYLLKDENLIEIMSMNSRKEFLSRFNIKKNIISLQEIYNS